MIRLKEMRAILLLFLLGLLHVIGVTNAIDLEPVSQDNKPLIKLTEKNHVIIRGPIDGPSSAKVINQLLKYQPGSELYIYLSTNGGSVISGMEIVRTMMSLIENKVQVKCIADTALSMGFVIFQYCPVRYVTLSSVLMQHQMSLGIQGPINQVSNYFQFIKSVETQLDVHQAQRIGVSVERFHEMMGHDWWLFGENSVRQKVADGMVDLICDFEMKYVNETIQLPWFGDVKVTYSNCPLARNAIQVSFSRDVTEEMKDALMNRLDMGKYIEYRLGNPSVDKLQTKLDYIT